MLVQRQANRRRIIILSVAFIVTALVGVVFASRRYLARPPSEQASGGTQVASNVSLSTIQSLNTSILSDPRLLELRARGGFSASPQSGVRVEDPNAPQPPGDVSIFDSGIGGSLSVTWTLPPDARITGVRIYRSDLAGEIGQNVIDLSASIDGYQDSGLTNGKTYYYLVRTTMTDGRESPNAIQQPGQPTDILPPQPPTNVKTESVDRGKAVRISWANPPDPDFSHVRIYRSTVTGEIGSVRFDLVQGSEISDETVSPGLPYYYTVVSVDTSGNESGLNLLSSPGKSNPFQPSF